MINDINKISSPRFFIIGTPDYGNLGDRALTIGEDNFIKTYFPNYSIVHLPLNILNRFNLYRIKKIINKTDKITFQAGGNFGSLYPGIHNKQERAIYSLRKFHIVVFPQTLFYSDDTMGQKMLKKTKKVYCSCSDLTITLRERVSYEFFQQTFPKTKALLIPDMVLNVPEFIYDAVRKGTFILLRNDLESTLSTDEYIRILKIIRNHFNSLEEIDTHVYYSLTEEEAKAQLNKYEYTGNDAYNSFFMDSFKAIYREDISNVPHSIAVIPFVCNILPIVWLIDAELTIDEIDRNFFDSIESFKKDI